MQMPGPTPVHWLSAVHGWHVFALRLQIGFVPVHALVSLALHSTHAPVPKHTGVPRFLVLH
jgi:hypothetical protein